MHNSQYETAIERPTSSSRCLHLRGNSIRATVRLTGISKNTITRLLVELGDACIDYQDRTLRNLKCKRVQCDDMWSFVYAKEKNVPAEMKGSLVWRRIDLDGH